MPHPATANRLLQCVVCGLAESCRNIRLSNAAKQALLPLYDAFSDDELRDLSQAPFRQSGRRRLPQGEYLSGLAASLRGRCGWAHLGAIGEQGKVQAEEMKVWCCAIWIKDEARALGSIAFQGGWLYIPHEERPLATRPDTPAARRRRAEVLLASPPAGGESEAQPGRVPRRITDIPFARSVSDVAELVTQAYQPRGIQALFVSNVVPAFYKKRMLPNGMGPQQYLAAIVSIFAEVLSEGSVLTLDVRPDGFVLESSGLAGPYSVEEARVMRGEGEVEVNADLLLACYPLWIAGEPTLPPPAFSVPMQAAEEVRRRISEDSLRSVGRLFPENSNLRWAPPGVHVMQAMAEVAHNADVKQLAWLVLELLGGELRLVSWPATFSSAMPVRTDGRRPPLP